MGESRLQHTVDNQELKDSFRNLYLDDDADGAAGSSGAGAGSSWAGTSRTRATDSYSGISILYLSSVTVTSVTWDL